MGPVVMTKAPHLSGHKTAIVLPSPDRRERQATAHALAHSIETTRTQTELRDSAAFAQRLMATRAQLMRNTSAVAGHESPAGSMLSPGSPFETATLGASLVLRTPTPTPRQQQFFVRKGSEASSDDDAVAAPRPHTMVDPYDT